MMCFLNVVFVSRKSTSLDNINLPASVVEVKSQWKSYSLQRGVQPPEGLQQGQQPPHGVQHGVQPQTEAELLKVYHFYKTSQNIPEFKNRLILLKKSSDFKT